MAAVMMAMAVVVDTARVVVVTGVGMATTDPEAAGWGIFSLMIAATVTDPGEDVLVRSDEWFTSKAHLINNK